MAEKTAEKFGFCFIKIKLKLFGPFLTFLSVVLFFYLKKFSYFRQSAVAETTEHVIDDNGLCSSLRVSKVTPGG